MAPSGCNQQFWGPFSFSFTVLVLFHHECPSEIIEQLTAAGNEGQKMKKEKNRKVACISSSSHSETVAKLQQTRIRMMVSDDKDVRLISIYTMDA